jgi:hypothetical protein
MEESESGEKQENTGIGPASACREQSDAIACPGRGAPLIRDRHGLERSTQVGLARLARILSADLE